MRAADQRAQLFVTHCTGTRKERDRVRWRRDERDAQCRDWDPYPPWKSPATLGWSRLGGADSVAAALALPLAMGSGAPFPHRGLLIYLAFSVILVTLVGQGLTLPLLIRWLGTVGDEAAEREE